MVIKATPTASLVASPTNPALVSNAATFTAGVTSFVGVPTGTLNFYDRTTLIGQRTLSAGAAKFYDFNAGSGIALDYCRLFRRREFYSGD